MGYTMAHIFIKKKVIFLFILFTLLLFCLLMFMINTSTDNTSISRHSKRTLSVKNTPTKRSGKSLRTTAAMKRDTCQPKRNILFLKTHKTGSSTVQNIFLRYGDQKNLTIVLPVQHNYFGHPQRFDRSMLLPKYNQSSLTSRNNIFTHHARYNYKEMKSIMPNNTLFITILRDPVSLTESLFSYYNLKRLFQETSSIHFLETFFSISPNISAYHALSTRRHLAKFGRNQMSFDLGFDIENFDNLELIHKFIQSINSQFHLVMIADRMDESLIHLRRLLCWTVDDIVVFRHNARSSNGVQNLSNALKQRIRLFNIADELLYKHFSDKLTRLTTKLGNETMQKEILTLKHVRQKMFNKCVDDKKNSNNMIVYYKQNQTMNKICQDLVISELAYTELLRQKHKKLKRKSKISIKNETTLL